MTVPEARRRAARPAPAGPQPRPADEWSFAIDAERRRVDVLGVRISAINRDEALACVADWIERGVQRYVCCTGVHGVMESQGDAALRHIHNGSGLTTPDGMPMVWACRWAGLLDTQRVYGPDLMLDVCELGAERGWRMYFYGGKESVPQLLASRLQARFPSLNVVGAHSPPFRPLTEEEVQREVEVINAAEPDVVWVGLSTPKQERWMASRVGLLEAPVLIGVGAAFDIHAGTLRQAPLWMQERGLEWLFRVAVEPRRLWRRYLYNIPRFAAAVARRRPRLIPET